jgi:CelD/BcsL family acetyltransferase involved in cellulose biosynthesis/predicted RNA methylase
MTFEKAIDTMLHVEFHTDASVIRDDWESIYQNGAEQSFCQSYIYAALASEFARQADAEIKIVTVHEGTEIVAIWPLVVYRQGIVRVLKPLSCGSDEEYSRPLVRYPERADIFAEIYRAIGTFQVDIIKIYNIIEHSPFDVMLANTERSNPMQSVSQLPAYHVTLRPHADWGDFVKTKTTSHWATLRRKYRKLEVEGIAEIGWCKSEADADQVLTWLFETKRRWMLDRGLHTPWLANDLTLQFFRKLAMQVDLTTYPLVSFVKINGVPVAAQVNLISESAFEFFITGYDPAFGHCSPGELLIEWSVKWAFEHRLDFDFRILESAYKKRWSDKVVNCVSREIRLTLLGKAYSKGAANLRRARRLYFRGGQMAGGFLTKVVRGVRRRINNQTAAITDRALDRKNGITTYVPRLKRPPDPNAEVGPYEPLSYAGLRLVEAHIKPVPTDVIYDIGCGMGRISCYFAQLNIAKSIGVEIDAELATIAEANFKTMHGKKAETALFVCDATQHDYSDATIIIMYNPFNVQVMANFLKQVERSLETKPRHIRIVLANPVARAAFVDCNWLAMTDSFEAPYGGHRMGIEIWSNAHSAH